MFSLINKEGSQHWSLGIEFSISLQFSFYVMKSNEMQNFRRILITFFQVIFCSIILTRTDKNFKNFEHVYVKTKKISLFWQMNVLQV